MEKLAAGTIAALIGVRTEVVTLGLQQIGGKPATTVAIEKCQSRCYGGKGNAEFHSKACRLSPSCFRFLNFANEEIVQQ